MSTKKKEAPKEKPRYWKIFWKDGSTSLWPTSIWNLGQIASLTKAIKYEKV